MPKPGFDVSDKAMGHLYTGIRNTPETWSGTTSAKAYDRAKNLGKFLHKKVSAGLQGAVDKMHDERTRPVSVAPEATTPSSFPEGFDKPGSRTHPTSKPGDRGGVEDYIP